MNQELNPTNGYVYIPEGSQILIVRDEEEDEKVDNKKEKNKKIDILYYLKNLKNYIFLIILITILITVLGTIASSFQKKPVPIYPATAYLFIEGKKPSKIVSLEEAIYGKGNADKHFKTQLQILKYRSLLEKLVDQLNLVSHPIYKNKKRNKIIDSIKEILHIKPVSQTQIVAISFESADRKLAAAVPNALAKIYIESDLDAQLEIANQTTSWLTNRLEKLRNQLQQSEQRLQAYMESENLVNITGIKTIASQQINATAGQLGNARNTLREAKYIYRQVQQHRGNRTDLESLPVILKNSRIQEFKSAELKAERELAKLQVNLTSSYSARHPKVIAARAVLQKAKNNTTKQIKIVLNSIRKEYEMALANVKALEHILKENEIVIQNLNRKEYQKKALEREIAVNRNLYELFLTRLKENNVAQEVKQLSMVGRLVEPALVPAKANPVLLNKYIFIIGSFVLGLLISIGIAFLLAFINKTIANAEDVKQKLKLPCLGTLPKLKFSRKNKFNARSMFLKEPNAPFSNAIRIIRTELMLSDQQNQNNIILITSSLPEDGKTTVALNQAFAFGQIDKTLLIEANIRQPTVAQTLGLNPKSPGLFELFTKERKWEECIYQINEVPQLDIILGGQIPFNPLELFSSKWFSELLQAVTPEYKYIIIHSPTVAFTETIVLAKLATKIVFVVKAKANHSTMVLDNIKRLEKVNTKIAGIILNN
ncbi:GumC family protein [Candidatus Marithrix sp. Canyon 246]|uniref:GumC family protein n=1 Tax=Candidatus Marithrix sp. Canyon 246 TaxID=1827136 RepID=UPI00084A11AE|nr:polysaccharide biosynthesis tyrosine autokinase [Candidatus Marithrix sp. Canyon 246]